MEKNSIINNEVSTSPNYDVCKAWADLVLKVKESNPNYKVEIKQDKNGYYFVVDGIEHPNRYAYCGKMSYGQCVAKDKTGVYRYVKFKLNGNNLSVISDGEFAFASDIKEGTSVVREINGNYRIRNAETGALGEEEFAWAGDSCCGVRRVKLANDNGLFRYRFADGSLSEQTFVKAEDFVDNHGLCKQTSRSGLQYVNIFKQLSQEFTSAENFKDGFGKVTFEGEPLYVDIIDNLTNNKTEDGKAIYKYLRGETSLKELKNEYILNPTIKSAVLKFTYFVLLNELSEQINSGKVITQNKLNEIVKEMKAFRLEVDNKENAANAAIKAEQEEENNRKGYVATLEKFIADALGLTLFGEQNTQRLSLPENEPKPNESKKEEPFAIQATNNGAEQEQVKNEQESKAQEKSEVKVVVIKEKPGLLNKILKLFKRKKQYEEGKYQIKHKNDDTIQIEGLSADELTKILEDSNNTANQKVEKEPVQEEPTFVRMLREYKNNKTQSEQLNSSEKQNRDYVQGFLEFLTKHKKQKQIYNYLDVYNELQEYINTLPENEQNKAREVLSTYVDENKDILYK